MLQNCTTVCYVICTLIFCTFRGKDGSLSGGGPLFRGAPGFSVGAHGVMAFPVKDGGGG